MHPLPDGYRDQAIYEMYLTSLPLLAYASFFWIHHYVRITTFNPDVRKLENLFLSTNNLYLHWVQVVAFNRIYHNVGHLELTKTQLYARSMSRDSDRVVRIFKEDLSVERTGAFPRFGGGKT